MCLYPKLIKNRKYIANQKNGGQPPPILDDRTEYVPVGCGNCIECRKKKAREWQVRLQEDIKYNEGGKFITLTFSDESIAKITEKIYQKCTEQKTVKPEGYELDNQIATYAVRHWLERWRKDYGKSLRHWLVTELGHNGTENIHLHGIIWTKEPLEKVEKHWSYGWMWKGKKIEKGKIENYVNSKTVNYIVKYVNKVDEKHPSYKSKVLTTPGIGAGYTQRKMGDWEKNKFKEDGVTNEAYRTESGHKLSLPIYMRNKIYSEEEREKLWIQKLDKQERWVLGNRIDVSNGEQEYWEAVKYARETNKELGYGTDEKDYDQEEYEKQIRILKQKTRIARATTEARYIPIHKEQKRY